MGTVTATLATLVPTRQIAPATRATLGTTVRWMTVSDLTTFRQQCMCQCVKVGCLLKQLMVRELVCACMHGSYHAYSYANHCVPSMLGVYTKFTCPNNSHCEGGRCRCNPGWTGVDCDMRELSCTYTDAALLGTAHDCTHPLSSVYAPFCNAVASNTCGYYNLTCHNNGSCISMYTGNGTYTYSCLCLPSFTGSDCSGQLPSESMTDCVNLLWIDMNVCESINSITRVF